MPTGVETPYGVAYKNYFYVFGGSTTLYASNSVATVQRYNKLTNTWDTPTSVPYGGYRENLARLLPNGKIYVAGGSGAAGYSNQVYWYDPETNTWEHKNNLPFPWCDPRIGLLPSGKLIISGVSINHVGTRVATCYIYDPADDT